MKRPLSIVFFVHSLRSDWNNGNAHFLRGLARSLARMGHMVRCYEPAEGWSYNNLLAYEGAAGQDAAAQFAAEYADVPVTAYRSEQPAAELIEQALREVDIAIVHEWSEPALAALILDAAKKTGTRTLFHDTHHRASSTPEQLHALQVDRFDGVIAFGEVLRSIYRERWGLDRVWTLHEAADTDVFRPIAVNKKQDVVWVGNWGDEERTKELREFLISPAKGLSKKKFAVYGVRYPEEGRAALAEAGIAYRGYLPNLSAPCVYAESLLTLHVPRRQYAESLPGIPTIRVFEALACGIPLISAPWQDAESLFHRGDFLMVQSAAQMTETMDELLRDEPMRVQQAQAGRETVLRRHTCAHRAAELTAICEELLP